MTDGYSDEVASLTPRMVDVLRSASLGRTAGETALELYISEHTVRSIRAAALARLGVPTIGAAIAVSIRAGRL